MPDRTPKQSTEEAEYFVREDAEKKRKIALHAKREKQAADLKRLKELHFMKCPKCGLDLHEVRLRGVDVDVCFSCEGVFFDKGDLDKLEKPGASGVMAAILNWFKPEMKEPV